MTSNKTRIEDVIKYWNNRPCNIRHSTKPIGTKEYFDEVEKRKYFVEYHIPGFACFDKWRNKKVLEIGCGIGTDSINFARNGAELIAVELSKNSLDICKKRFDVYGERAQFYLSNSEKLSETVPIQKVDLIYSFGVIHHSPHPELIIEEIKKYMGNETELRIMLYAKYSWKNFMIKLGLMQPEAQTGCPIYEAYSKKGVSNLLKEMEIVSCTKAHIFPYVIEEYKKYKYVRAFPWNVMPKSLFNLLEKKLGWHLLITARLKS
jgi:SAM-dependent methyltransferase